jgi:hypothetical protein
MPPVVVGSLERVKSLTVFQKVGTDDRDGCTRDSVSQLETLQHATLLRPMLMIAPILDFPSACSSMHLLSLFSSDL